MSGLVLPTVGSAHARLVNASPADGSDLAAAPGELKLCFSELLESQFNVIEWGPEPPPGQPSSRPLTPVAATIDPGDGVCLTAALPPLAPGAYVVRWRVVSRDGHATRGRLHFHVK
jgi:methionine-rich copper-binding protein CopC